MTALEPRLCPAPTRPRPRHARRGLWEPVGASGGLWPSPPCPNGPETRLEAVWRPQKGQKTAIGRAGRGEERPSGQLSTVWKAETGPETGFWRLRRLKLPCRCPQIGLGCPRKRPSRQAWTSNHGRQEALQTALEALQRQEAAAAAGNSPIFGDGFALDRPLPCKVPSPQGKSEICATEAFIKQSRKGCYQQPFLLPFLTMFSPPLPPASWHVVLLRCPF